MAISKEKVETSKIQKIARELLQEKGWDDMNLLAKVVHEFGDTETGKCIEIQNKIIELYQKLTNNEMDGREKAEGMVDLDEEPRPDNRRKISSVDEGLKAGFNMDEIVPEKGDTMFIGIDEISM